MAKGIDFSQLKKFIASNQRIVSKKEINKFLRDFLAENAEEVVKLTEAKTPVDTGALKAAWKLGEVFGEGVYIFVEIKNNQEYATFVEFGHAGRYSPESGVTENVGIHWTEGRFMLTKSKNYVNKRLANRFEKALAEKFKEWGYDVK